MRRKTTYEMVRIIRDDESQWFVASIESFGGVIAQGISVEDAALTLRSQVASMFARDTDVNLENCGAEGWFLEVVERS